MKSFFIATLIYSALAIPVEFPASSLIKGIKSLAISASEKVSLGIQPISHPIGAMVPQASIMTGGVHLIGDTRLGAEMTSPMKSKLPSKPIPQTADMKNLKGSLALIDQSPKRAQPSSFLNEGFKTPTKKIRASDPLPLPSFASSGKSPVIIHDENDVPVIDSATRAEFMRAFGLSGVKDSDKVTPRTSSFSSVMSSPGRTKTPQFNELDFKRTNGDKINVASGFYKNHIASQGPRSPKQAGTKSEWFVKKNSVTKDKGVVWGTPKKVVQDKSPVAKDVIDAPGAQPNMKKKNNNLPAPVPQPAGLQSLLAGEEGVKAIPPVKQDRFEFRSKAPVSVQQYLRVNKVYEKSGKRVNEILVARGTLNNGIYTIDHLHGTEQVPINI